LKSGRSTRPAMVWVNRWLIFSPERRGEPSLLM
jgi:hypothetical protein